MERALHAQEQNGSLGLQAITFAPWKQDSSRCIGRGDDFLQRPRP
jgi:hypothetical protein